MCPTQFRKSSGSRPTKRQEARPSTITTSYWGLLFEHHIALVFPHFAIASPFTGKYSDAPSYRPTVPADRRMVMNMQPGETLHCTNIYCHAVVLVQESSQLKGSS